MEKEIRRRQNRLSITGIGVIFFGLWNFTKLLLTFLLAKNSVRESIGTSDIVDPDTMFVLVFVFCILFSLGELALRVWLGRGAILESRGERSRYLGLCIFLLIYTFAAVLIEILTLSFANSDFLDRIAAILVDLSSVIMLFELAFSTIRLRRLTKVPAPVREG